MEKDINNLEEIINLCKEEINNNDKNITATLDLEDLKSLKNLLTGYKQLEEENEYMKSLFKVQASIAQELDFDTPDKMTKFKDTYYVPDTMAITNNIGEPKRLDLSYVDVSKFLGKE